jgi:hypothetical protein
MSRDPRNADAKSDAHLSSKLADIEVVTDATAWAQAIMARVAPPERILSDELMAERRQETIGE